MIEKVGYSKPVNATKGVRRTGSTDGVAFASALSAAEGVSATEATEATSPIAPMTSVGLLGIQEVNGEELERRKRIKRGRLTLDALEKLRNGLLTGSVPMSSLRALERLVAEERGHTNDPRLQGILDEIELRAAVEIAKLEVAGLLPPL